MKAQKVLKKGITIAISTVMIAGLFSGCNKKGSTSEEETVTSVTAEEVLVESIDIPENTYEYDAEEIMYLSGVKLTAYKSNTEYSLSDLDGDYVSELFVGVTNDGVKTVGVYAFDTQENKAKLICTYEDAKEGYTKEPGEDYVSLIDEVRNTPDRLLWVEGTQWVDASIIGVPSVVADPGLKTDFYLSSNYEWLSDQQVQYRGDSVTEVDMTQIIRDRKDEMFTDEDKYQGKDIQLLRDYYAVATDWEKRDADGIEPVKKYIKEIEGLKTLDDMTKFLSDPEKSVFCNFLTLDTSLDVNNTEDWVLEISGDHFSILPRQYNNEDEEEIEASRSDFTTPVTEILSSYGYKDDEISKMLEESYSLENNLLTKTWISDEEYTGALDGYLTYEVFTSNCKNFPLEEILKGYGITKGRITATYPEYVEYLDEFYKEENFKVLKSYLLTHTVFAAYEYLDSDILNSATEFDSKDDLYDFYNDGYKNLVLSNHEILGVAEENAYMTFFIDDEVKKEIIDMCADIKAAYRSILEEEEWLSEEGKKAAIEKLDNLEFCVLKPDTLIDSSYLQVDKDASYLANFANLSISQRKHNLSFVGEKRVKGDWRYDLRPEIAATVDNAFYYGCFNQFFICSMGVNEFRPEYSYEENLGKLGAIIGHELTHGFDPMGIQYDKDGNMVVTDENPSGWLPQADYDAFMEKMNKVAEYYSNIKPFPYTAVDGNNVWGEATADIGGITIGLKIAEGIEGFDYDKYFRSFSTDWMTQVTLIGEQGDVNNEHPLRYLRVNTVLSQFEKFYETYDIKEGDLMYLAPEDRITVW